MKSPIITSLALLVAALLVLGACGTIDDSRRPAPPPGSASPFGQTDRSDPAGSMRDQPEPPPIEDREDEPEEPEQER